jgi:hypothetical protein
MCAKSQPELDGFFESPEDNPPARLLMIRAYLDESGHEQKQHVIVAGHAGTESAWRKFIPAWQQALGPQRKRLHMQELRWSKLYTRGLLAKLGEVPARCGLVRVIGGVKVSDYEDLVSGTEVEKMFKGYIPALFTAVNHLLIAAPDDDKVEIVIEHQHEYLPYVENAFAAIRGLRDKRLYRSDGVHKLARWGFGYKEDTALFDQADYLAYAVLQDCRDPESTRAKWCSPILKGGKSCGEVLTRKQARDALLNAPPLLTDLLNKPIP